MFGRLTNELAAGAPRPFDAVVVEVEDDDPTRGTVTLADPAVEARVTGTGPLPLGEQVRVRLVEASVADRRVRFEPR